MTAITSVPAVLDITSGNNEDFDGSCFVGLPGEAFPMDNATWHMQLRRQPGNVEVALEFITADGSLVMSDPQPAGTPPGITLSFHRPASAVAALSGVYVSDLKMIRGSRKVIIASGTVTFTQGISIEP